VADESAAMCQDIMSNLMVDMVEERWLMKVQQRIKAAIHFNKTRRANYVSD
jgi:hypothetical protein